jgi:hypothetical protein
MQEQPIIETQKQTEEQSLMNTVADLRGQIGQLENQLNTLTNSTCELDPQTAASRQRCAYLLRELMARVQRFELNPNPVHPCNGDEAFFESTAQMQFRGRFPASFTKGFKHDPQTGELDLTNGTPNFRLLLRALDTGNYDLLEQAMLGCMGGMQRPLENPQAAIAFDLEGIDSHQAGILDDCQVLPFPEPPSFRSKEEIAEMAELYWMTLLRDIPFSVYETLPLAGGAAPSPEQQLILDAAADLDQFDEYKGRVEPRNLFRGHTAGDVDGPYASQFLLFDAPLGATFIPARIRTLKGVQNGEGGRDFMTSWNEWLMVQDGCNKVNCPSDPADGPCTCQDTPCPDGDARRYIRNGRDLAAYVHIDTTWQAFMQAARLLLSSINPAQCEPAPGFNVDFAPGLPYRNAFIEPVPPRPGTPPRRLPNQTGFVTFGPRDAERLLLEVHIRALKAVWYQKWSLHRRLRPEEFGGRIEAFRRINRRYPWDTVEFAKLEAEVLPRIRLYSETFNGAGNGTYLLPQVYAEGSPMHPAYGSGHSTVAGACATVLKAYFDEESMLQPIPRRDGGFLPVLEAAEDGCSVHQYQGMNLNQLLVRDEVNKLASNIGVGRLWAGVHWRSDHFYSLLLGEMVAVSLLVDQALTFSEEHYFEFTSFLGDKIQIDRKGIGARGPSGESRVSLCDNRLATLTGCL